MRYGVVVLAFLVLIGITAAGAFAQIGIRNDVVIQQGTALGNFRTLAITQQRDRGDIELEYWNDGAKEQFGDAAWIARHGFIPMVFVIKDANENTMCLEYLRLYRRVGGTRTLIQEVDRNRTISNDQFYYYGGLGVNEIGIPIPGIGDTMLFEWELKFRDGFLCLSSHLSRYFNRVTIGEPLPGFPNWFRTDTHYHTRFTDNVFEFGGFMWVVRHTAQAIDLDVVCITDHSTDIKTGNDMFGWKQLVSEADSLTDETVLLIPGEELTVDSNESNEFPDNRIHLLAIGLTRPLLAPEECCSQNASSRLWTLHQAMDSIAVQNAVAMAAHPSRTFGVGYGGKLTRWSDANFDIALTYLPFVASEFFNERRTVFNNTIENDDNLYPYDWTANPNWGDVWKEALTDYFSLVQRSLQPFPRKIALAGGSDAHGDFADKKTNQYGLIGKVANDDAMGRVHTLVHSAEGLTRDGILNGMRQGAMIMSDGPALELTLDHDGNGSQHQAVGVMTGVASNASFRIRGQSINELGPFTEARFIHVVPSMHDTVVVPLSGLSVDTTVPAYQFAVPGSWSVVVVEVRTSLGYRATASPVYIAPQGTIDVEPAQGGNLSLSAAWPNPASDRVTFMITAPLPIKAQIEIFDISGRKVVDHLLGMLSPGTMTYTWDGSDDSGARLPTGVYHVRLLAANRAFSRKVVLLR